MLSYGNLLPSNGDCKDCKFRGAAFRDTKIFCNQVKILVEIQHCKHYEKDDSLPDNLLRGELGQREANEGLQEKLTIENESLNKIVDFFAHDNSWFKLRRILTKDVLSTTVLLNYLEHNDDAKKKFMEALALMAQEELGKIKSD
jgi:hypothetical protein